jgi:hypothetical protein
MSKPIELRFKYTEDEYVAAIRAYMLGRTRITFVILMASVMLILGVYFLISGIDIAMTVSLLCTSAFLFGLLATSILILPRRRFQADPKFRDEYLLGFTDDGILFKTDHIDAKVDWGLYTEAVETDRFYLLVYGKGAMSVIPKRVFHNPEEEALFKNLITRRVAPNSRPLTLGTSLALEEKDDYVPPPEPPDWR